MLVYINTTVHCLYMLVYSATYFIFKCISKYWTVAKINKCCVSIVHCSFIVTKYLIATWYLIIYFKIKIGYLIVHYFFSILINTKLTKHINVLRCHQMFRLTHSCGLRSLWSPINSHATPRLCLSTGPPWHFPRISTLIKYRRRIIQ